MGNNWRISIVNIFTKGSILDVWQGSECTTGVVEEFRDLSVHPETWLLSTMEKMNFRIVIYIYIHAGCRDVGKRISTNIYHF